MYRGETCDECGMAVAFFTRSYWHAPDALWNEVVGTDAGTLCPPCFTLAARQKGIPVHWRAQRTLVYLDHEDVPLGEPLTVEPNAGLLAAQSGTWNEPPAPDPALRKELTSDGTQKDFWRPTGECPETCG